MPYLVPVVALSPAANLMRLQQAPQGLCFIAAVVAQTHGHMPESTSA